MQDHPYRNGGQIPVISGYRDLALIADGGFSSVYTARQERFDRTVAVKILHAGLRDAEAQRRFGDECRLTGRLTGEPHIITVFDAGMTEDGRPFLAMQYLPGGSLADRLASSGPLPVSEVTRVGTAIASALAAAHEAGILHRDIKPGNILMSAGGEPVISDFGIAGRHRSGMAALDPDPAEDAFTPAHTAPEVQEGAPSSAASDVYSLGSTLYTLLAGTPPFSGASGKADRLARISSGDFPDLERADLPAGLMALIRRCLAYEPAQRPGSARELAADLAAFQGPAGSVPPADSLISRAEGGGGASGTLPHGASAAAADDPTRVRPERIQSRSADPGSRSRHRTVMTVFAAAAALAVLAAVGVAVARVVPGSQAAPGVRVVSRGSGQVSRHRACLPRGSEAALRGAQARGPDGSPGSVPCAGQPVPRPCPGEPAARRAAPRGG